MKTDPQRKVDMPSDTWRRLLHEAHQLQRAGAFDRAAQICRQIIDAWPGEPEALHLLGIIAYQCGRCDEAVALLRKALESAPFDLNIYKNLILILKTMGKMNDAIPYCRQALVIDSENDLIYSGLGDLFCSNGYFDIAADCYRKVLATRPVHGAAWGGLGNALHESGQLDEAIACYLQALPLDPDNAELHYNLGVAQSGVARFGEAVSSFKNALALNPGHAKAWFNLGNTFKGSGRVEAAIDCYRQCIQLNDTDTDAWYNLANALYAQGEIQAALDCYGATLERKPDHAPALNNLGCLLKEIGADERSINVLKQSILIDPTSADAYVNLGSVYKERNDFDAAIQAYESALSLAPDHPDALISLGSLLKREGRFNEGLRYLKRAVKASPEISTAWWYYYLALPVIYQTESEVSQHRERFSQGLSTLTEAVKLDTPERCRRALAGTGSLTNFYLQYQGMNDLVLQRRYGNFIHQVMAANYPMWTVPRPMPPYEPGARIRIGYLSSFMRSHTVGHFLMGWLKNHNHHEFELHCYHIGTVRDGLTEAFERESDHFCHLAGNIEAVAKRILEDDLHILVYTDIGMYAPATQLAGLRLAPIQCKGWGHPVTTGLPTIDYYLSADLMEGDGAEAHYSEKLIRLPNLALALEMPSAPENGWTRQEFGIPEGDFVFLTSQSLFKYLPQFDDIYPRIAAGTPNVKFVFISNPSAGITRRFQARLAEAFKRSDLVMDRYCIFQPRLSAEDFLRLNRLSDVLLDPFCWSGGKTTIEAISCGLPVVTCPGVFMRSRHAYAMLKMMGVTQTIAADADDYVAIARRLAMDKDFFDCIKSAVENNRSRIFGDVSCVRYLEEFYKNIVTMQQFPQEASTGE